MTDKTLEAQLRRRAIKRGYRLTKSRERTLHTNNKGHYQLVRIDRNEVAAGTDYDIPLNEAAEWIASLPDASYMADHAKQLREATEALVKVRKLIKEKSKKD